MRRDRHAANEALGSFNHAGARTTTPRRSMLTTRTRIVSTCPCTVALSARYVTPTTCDGRAVRSSDPSISSRVRVMACKVHASSRTIACVQRRQTRCFFSTKCDGLTHASYVVSHVDTSAQTARTCDHRKCKGDMHRHPHRSLLLRRQMEIGVSNVPADGQQGATIGSLSGRAGAVGCDHSTDAVTAHVSSRTLATRP